MKKLLIALSFVLIISMVLTACKSSTSTTTTTKPATTTVASTTPAVTTTKPATTTTAATSTTPVAPVKIGLLEDVTGAVGVYGTSYIAGAKVAIQMINDAGGIKSLGGAKLTYVLGQGDSTATTSVSEAIRLVTNENVSAILGPTATAEVLAMIPTMEQYKIPMINGLADPAQFTKGYQYEFGMLPPTDLRGTLQADFIAWLAKNYGAKLDRIAFASQSPGYTPQTDTVISRLAALGYKNVVLNDTFLVSVTDQSPLVLKLKAANPTFVVYNGTPADSILFFKACLTYDYAPFMVLSSSAFQPATRDGLGADAKKAMTRPNIFAIGNGLVTDAYTQVASLKAFQDAFAKANPGSTMDPGFVANGGQKVFVLARALEMAASRNPVDIAAALRKVDIVAPDSYLCLAEQYPQLKMSASGLTSSGTNQGVQWNADMTAFQTVWPEAIATAKPRVQ